MATKPVPFGVVTESDTDTVAAGQRLSETIEAVGPMVVAFSGGVDSALLALAAHRVLGTDMVAVTASSASLAIRHPGLASAGDR